MKLHGEECHRRKCVRSLGFILAILLRWPTSTDTTNPCHGLSPGLIPHPCHASACLPCEPGFGVEQYCNGSRPTVCKPCVAGVNYSKRSDVHNDCESVTRCKLNEIVDSPATTTTDVVCKCQPGYQKVTINGGIKFCKPVVVSVVTPTGRSARTPITVTSLSPRVFSRSTLRPKKTHTTFSRRTSSLQHTSTSSGRLTSASATSDLLEKMSSRPTSREVTLQSNRSTADVSGQNAGASSAVIAAGVGVGVVVLVTGLVVAVAWRYCRQPFTTDESGQRLGGESDGISDKNEVHYCSVGSSYALTADVDTSCWRLPWRTSGFFWLKDGASLQSSYRMVVQNNSVTFATVEVADAGKYSFINNSNTIQQEIEFLVKEDLEPYYYRDAGSAITLSFVVHGSNSTTWRYQWHRESGVFDSSSVVHSGETTPTLTISRVSGQEKYWCVASNPDKGLTLESSRASVIADGSDETPSPRELGRETEQRLKHANEERQQIVCMENLTPQIMEGLAIKMQARDYPMSLRLIAEQVGVDDEKLESCISTNNEPARFILQELRSHHPRYSLANLCFAFLASRRPECARKLYTLVIQDGRSFSLPDWITDDVYPDIRDVGQTFSETTLTSDRVTLISDRVGNRCTHTQSCVRESGQSEGINSKTTRCDARERCESLRPSTPPRCSLADEGNTE